MLTGNRKKILSLLACTALVTFGAVSTLYAVPLPGGTLDPLTIPKYKTTLVIPPVMPKSTVQPVGATNPADYNIAVRQFQQQILPAPLPPTTVWSYGNAQDTAPAVAPVAVGTPGATFNYPAWTIETPVGTPNKIRWINDLKDPVTGNYLTYFLPTDQTVHWANPTGSGCVNPLGNLTDCSTANPGPYTGPVPIVVHVHGSDVNDLSDGYPEAWFLPAASNIPAGYVVKGSKFTEVDPVNNPTGVSTFAPRPYPQALPGASFYLYDNNQPATTIWYHDHAEGVTRLNVYAGMAGFYLLRGGPFDGGTNVRTRLPAVLPGPAPTVGQDPNFVAATRKTIREVPLAIQDRSFNTDGSLFYPPNRAFFDGFLGPYIPTSDISPTINPEAFLNTMVVNGTAWPNYDVAPARYRLRLLNGCDSRTLNLAMNRVVYKVGLPDNYRKGPELPFYQIGGDQGFLPKVTMISTGFTTQLPGNGTIPRKVASTPGKGLVIMPGERADVIVDFTGLPNGTKIRIFNIGPDMPFQGFPIALLADPTTTGQVMEFTVNNTLKLPSDALTTRPQDLALNAEPANAVASSFTRPLSLNELASDQVCVDPLTLVTIFTTVPNDPNFAANCAAAAGVPMAPRQVRLGTATVTPGVSVVPTPMRFMDAISENPALNATETWELYNFTIDGHPMHLHLVRFQLLNRQALDPVTNLPIGPLLLPDKNELGFKDTIQTLPGMVTRVKATFARQGLYVWHCHILSHEDNEMMRPLYVGPIPTNGGIM